jgi:hypothetical protein
MNDDLEELEKSPYPKRLRQPPTPKTRRGRLSPFDRRSRKQDYLDHYDEDEGDDDDE